MEALELHHAEQWQPVTVRRSYAEMCAHHTVPDRDELPVARSAPFPASWPYSWTMGWDLVHQEEVALPVGMIHLGNRATRLRELHTFQRTSNGLASGNDLLEAIGAALFEVIERDAVTCHQERWLRRDTPPPLIDLSTVAFPAVREMIDRINGAGAEVLLFDCTVDTCVPVYMVYLYDEAYAGDSTFRGYGAHLDPEVALLRALTEAAQARVVHIAGSRDDVFRHREVHTRTSQAHAAVHALASGQERVPAPAPGAGTATDTVDGDVTGLLRRLVAAGLRRVVVVDLSSPHFPIDVVKVVVPGLEGYRMESYAPGPRAEAFATGDGPS
jgi:ribosomal protein S12 methylthiotransferase accessory factor